MYKRQAQQNGFKSLKALAEVAADVADETDDGAHVDDAPGRGFHENALEGLDRIERAFQVGVQNGIPAVSYTHLLAGWAETPSLPPLLPPPMKKRSMTFLPKLLPKSLPMMAPMRKNK